LVSLLYNVSLILKPIKHSIKSFYGWQYDIENIGNYFLLQCSLCGCKLIGRPTISLKVRSTSIEIKIELNYTIFLYEHEAHFCSKFKNNPASAEGQSLKFSVKV